MPAPRGGEAGGVVGGVRTSCRGMNVGDRSLLASDWRAKGYKDIKYAFCTCLYIISLKGSESSF